MIDDMPDVGGADENQVEDAPCCCHQSGQSSPGNKCT